MKSATLRLWRSDVGIVKVFSFLLVILGWHQHPAADERVGRHPPRDLFFRYRGGPPWAIRSGNRKLQITLSGQELLFDLSGMQEKAIKDPALAAQLKSRLMDWNSQLIPPLWPPS